MALKSILVSSFFPLCKDLFYTSGLIFKLPRILVFNDHNKYFFRSDHATHNCYLINYLSNSHKQIEAPVFFSQKVYQQVYDMRRYVVNHLINKFLIYVGDKTTIQIQRIHEYLKSHRNFDANV